jgi:hypothetical protein
MFRTALIAALLLVGCSSQQSPRPVLANATVELDAFSGRPNPRWQLSVEEARDLEARLSGLERADGAKLPDVGLGYRGFYIHYPDGQRIHVVQGLIAFPHGEQSRVLYRDVRSAETALKAQAIARGYGPIVRAR